MNLQSKMGFRDDSPYRNMPVNLIQSGNITMNGVSRPIIGTDGHSVVKMQPGGSYRFSGSQVAEVPQDKLMEVEPLLLELHLKSLTGEDKEVFMNMYNPLDDEDRLAVVEAMFRKHGRSLAKKITMQDGGTYIPQATYVNDRAYLPKDEMEKAGFALSEVVMNHPVPSNTVDVGRFPQGGPMASSPKPSAPKSGRVTGAAPKAPATSAPVSNQVGNNKYDSLSNAALIDNYVSKVQMGIKDREVLSVLVGRGLSEDQIMAGFGVSDTTRIVNASVGGQGTIPPTLSSSRAVRQNPYLGTTPNPKARFDPAFGDVMYQTPYGEMPLGESYGFKRVDVRVPSLFYDRVLDNFYSIGNSGRALQGDFLPFEKVESMSPGSYDKLKRDNPRVPGNGSDVVELKVRDKNFSVVKYDPKRDKFYGKPIGSKGEKDWVILLDGYVERLAPTQYRNLKSK